jgi:hypothetical protein
MRHGLDFVDLHYPKIRRPPVRLEERIMIGAEMPWCAPTTTGGVEPAAKVGAIDRTTVHVDSDEATGELVHDDEHPVAPEHSHRKRSTLHRLSLVCPMNDSHDGPVLPGAGDRVSPARGTTFLSMSTPNVCEMMRAIRGQPKRGWRDVSSTMAWMGAVLGPVGPSFLGRGVDENSRRYLQRTKA